MTTAETIRATIRRLSAAAMAARELDQPSLFYDDSPALTYIAANLRGAAAQIDALARRIESKNPDAQQKKEEKCQEDATTSKSHEDPIKDSEPDTSSPEPLTLSPIPSKSKTKRNRTDHN